MPIEPRLRTQATAPVKINSHVAYYLASKVAAGALNVGTMVVFVRFAGFETYGAYVVAMAWACVIYGSTLQWLRFSFFATYRLGDGDELISTYLQVVLLGAVVLAIVFATISATGVLPVETAFAVFFLIVGLAVYEAFHEIARTRLQARNVALGVMARAILMPGLGVASLMIFGSAWALAIAVGLAHLGAAVVLGSHGRNTLTRWAPAAASRLWSYGKALIPAYGLDSMGLQIDRLMLTRFAPLSDVGSYGAVADLIRQVMVVVAEAIAGAYIAVARAEVVAGRESAAVEILGRAFLAFTALAAFVAAFILRFDRLLLNILFGHGVGDTLKPLVGLMVASSAVAIFRGYYFGQVLYLTQDGRLLFFSNALHAFVVAGVGLLLIPSHGMFGAAMALLLGHVAGCSVYMWAWRDHFVTRLPFASAFIICAMATTAFLATGALERLLGGGLGVAALNAAIFGATAMLAALRFNLLSFHDFVMRARRMIGP
jgi:O-antigen/teichoic acid export membrane protein